jgi:hypothetical protein
MKISIGKVELILTKEDPNLSSGLPFLFYKAENEEELVSLVRFLQSDEAKAVSKVYVLVADTQKAMEVLKKNLNL